MKIVSFNTYLAPTTPNRYNRRNLLLEKITQWNNEGVDVICLQEQNSHKIGCLSRIIYKFSNNRLVDCFSIVEGLLCPFYTCDNTKFIKDYIDDNNLDYKFIYENSKPTYSVNNGLIILSVPFKVFI